MKPSKNLAITALALFSVATSVVAWKSYWKAAQLEAAAAGAEDVTALRRQLAEAEKRRRELEASTAGRLAAKDAAGETASGERERAPGETGRGRGRGGPGGGRGADFQAVMDRPELQRLASLQQKAALDGRYGSLFKALNLSGDQLATFKALLAEKDATMMDTMRAAREQGLDPRSDPEGFKKLMATTQAETNAAIKAAIGDTAFAQYEQYQATQPQRAVVSQLQQSLSYTSEPLSTAQAEQLVQVLAATAPQSGPGTFAGTPPEVAGGGGRGGPMGGAGGGSALITAATVTQAQAVLSTTQLQALQDLQTLQQAQQQAQQLMRAAGVGGPPQGGGRAAGGD